MEQATIYITQFIHDTTRGLGGGADCVGCHDIGGSAPVHIDVTAMKSGVHSNLNNNATNITQLTDTSKACWACHGDGSEPSSHPSNYKTPYKCEDCHAYSDRHNITSDVYNTIGGISVVNITSCITCHDASLYNNATSTYGYNKTRDCDYCHTYPDKTYS